MLVSPEAQIWFHREPQPSGMLGAAVLLHADAGGYLFATANHVAASKTGVMISTGNGGWTHGDIVARNSYSDAALLWLRRRHGQGEFCQPVAPREEFRPGEPVFVIGHPEGLNFTLSSGLISRIPGDAHIQIDAPVSPGNSGGPVYDGHGNLLAVVVASVDNLSAPNAQNLNFAVRSDRVAQLSGWIFSGNGKIELEQYREQCLKQAHP
jgi:S1-C subfamily serine protease